jgi:hypothetical protein
MDNLKYRPILFSATMVRAILAGTKTQTRRVVKGAPNDWAPTHPQTLYPTVVDSHGDEQPGSESYGAGNSDGDCWIRCPYGQPGDRLWVRETFYCDDAFFPDGLPVSCRWREVEGQRVAIPLEEQRAEMLESMYYRADGEPEWEGTESPTPWRPSIHMPRWASRITLEVTGVRVERLNACSADDAKAEGIGEFIGGWACLSDDAPQQAGSTPQEGYRHLWETINGAGSWNANPWVWVIEFKRVTP